jgi:hypothetical protein
MKRFDFRIILGSALFLLGGLMFLEQAGLLKGASDLFWGVVMVGAGAAFLYSFFSDFKRNWWMVIPGLTLVGMGADAFLPQQFEAWSGGLFLGALGLSFWIIYFTNRGSWWAIIPGGVLLTLAAVSVLDEFLGSIDSGGVFFIGLGLTFLLVAILPNGGRHNMQWAYIPAVILVVMGAFLGNRAAEGLTNYVWPIALILVGVMIVFGFFMRKE